MKCGMRCPHTELRVSLRAGTEQTGAQRGAWLGSAGAAWGHSSALPDAVVPALVQPDHRVNCLQLEVAAAVLDGHLLDIALQHAGRGHTGDVSTPHARCSVHGQADRRCALRAATMCSVWRPWAHAWLHADSHCACSERVWDKLRPAAAAYARAHLSGGQKTAKSTSRTLLLADGT